MLDLAKTDYYPIHGHEAKLAGLADGYGSFPSEWARASGCTSSLSPGVVGLLQRHRPARASPRHRQRHQSLHVLTLPPLDS